ncbi:MAG TPA: sensor domain-containing diguanylate cyclase [Actinoplanes sp.]|nr:sensor domain-containing diguanylate cyclase [Actinoplanes sp.]
MEPRETSGVTVHAIVRHVAQRGGDEAVRQMLDRAGATADVAAYLDKRRWWSYDTKIALFAAAADVLGEDEIGLRVAEAVLAHSVGAAERLALSLTGGPARLLQMVAKAGAKFSAVSDLRAPRVTRGSAEVEYRLHDGHRPSRFDCDYTRGLLAQVPPVFGLPPATVSHTSCQVRGADSCRYEVRWRPPRARWRPWRRADRDAVLERAMLGQLEQLQRTVAELVAARDPAQALATVADRAGYAVNAHAFLLVARPSAEAPTQVHSFGLSPAEVARYTSDRAVPAPAPGRLVARIASGQSDYGHLIAFGHDFFDADRDLLDAYANLAAVAMDTLSAVTTAAERRRTAESLLALSSALTRAESRQEVAQVTVEAACAMLSADRASVLLLDEDATLRVAGHVGWRPEFTAKLDALTVTSADTAHLSRMLDRPDLPQIHDRSTDDPFIRAVLDEFELDSIVVVAIALPDRFYGIIVAHFDGPHGVAQGRRFAVDMAGAANQAASVLCSLELRDQTWRQANLDALTGIPNRRAFMTALDETLAAGGGGLLFIDLDGFKAVNDTLGHAAGDRLLIVVAERLAAALAGGGLLARLAGDEFVVLSTEVHGAADLAELADRLARVFAEPVRLGDTTVPVRASIGTTLFTAGQDREDVLHRADTAMYEAKRSLAHRELLADATG